MMKKFKYQYIMLTSLLFCLCHSIATAQIEPDSSVTKLAARLSVSQEKAGQIKAAYNYHQDDIIGLIKNHTIGAKEKQRQLKQLLAERQTLLNATVSRAQQTQLTNADTVLLAHLKTEKAAVSQRHQEEINRMPHRHIEESQLPSPKQQ